VAGQVEYKAIVIRHTDGLAHSGMAGRVILVLIRRMTPPMIVRGVQLGWRKQVSVCMNHLLRLNTNARKDL
jgi:hypothetical protein